MFILTNQHHLLVHVNLGCNQRECKPNEIINKQYREMFESRISPGATDKLPGWQKLHAKTVAWSHDMEDRLKNALRDTANWREQKDRAVIQSLKSLLGELESVGELSNVCSLNCLEMLVLGTNWLTFYGE